MKELEVNKQASMLLLFFLLFFLGGCGVGVSCYFFFSELQIKRVKFVNG